MGEDPRLKEWWVSTKTTLPPVITGAWNLSDGDKNPGGALYNMVFVRIPIIFAALVYAKFLIDGNHLTLDFGFGGGPTELPPLLVAIIVVIYLI